MKYFNNCNTIDQAKNEFRKLCMVMHPDKGGIASEFIKMYDEFKSFKPTVKRDQESETFNAEAFYNTVQKFEGLEGLEINFVGSFIWLEGETHKNKEAIKAIKLEGYKPPMWANTKKAWFFSPNEYKSKSRGKQDLNEIKSVYGCQTFKTKSTYKLA